ncbi:helix-turn-helix domain-containing protein [Amycolatopsis sp. NPDC089917]|uniref:helix-turn-helix domain-containing protein n=1 Tax=Amycolatopsis sp. NPDC089917 TaxID=3155187 RepID=UPI00343183F3
MRVRDLLDLPALRLRVVWTDAALTSRDVAGAVVTDLADPTRFVRAGDLVLTGLVWWSPDDGAAKADRFAEAVAAAHAAALLAGEETHGEVPAVLADACRRHSVPLLAVPADTDFRAVTDAVYLRRWGGLDATAGPALPESARRELDRLLTDGAPLDDVLTAACAPLGDLACYVVTTTGRVLARTASATAPIEPGEDVRRRVGTTLRIDAGATVYDTWLVHAPTTAGTPPGALREIAETISRFQRAQDQRLDADRKTANRLATAITTRSDETVLRAALRRCGLPADGPYLVHSLTMDDSATAARALAEALAELPNVVGVLPRGEAIAIQSGTSAPPPALWEALQACDPRNPLVAGTSTALDGPDQLPAGLTQARHAAEISRSTGALTTSAGEQTGFEALVSGLDPLLRKAFRRRVLGPLLDRDTVLLDTVTTFLACDGSWARTARTLHVHVNTVHYRIERAEEALGRNLSRLDDRLDLRAALLC